MQFFVLVETLEASTKCINIINKLESMIPKDIFGVLINRIIAVTKYCNDDVQ